MELFPTGVWSFLVGGLLVGTGVALIFLTTGLRAGASSVLTTTWSWFTARDYFQREVFLQARGWRLVFSAGLILGAALFVLTAGRELGDEPGASGWVTAVAPWRLLVGGLLVGFGTRLSRGCTSGHGICGLAAGSKPSLLAVMTFMGVAIATAWATRALGVTP